MIEVKRLIWEGWNVNHIQRHEVTPEEVEEVCSGDCLVLDGHHGRLLLVGKTNGGRILAVVLDPEPEVGVYYPVTARPASRRDRRLYHAAKGGEDIHDEIA